MCYGTTETLPKVNLDQRKREVEVRKIGLAMLCDTGRIHATFPLPPAKEDA